METVKYDNQINPAYQIDFSNSRKGKRFGMTKRCVNFRFGFSNPEAIANSRVGADCRGEEHDVTLIWSITSGKRTVKLDNREVHYSTGKVTDVKFECAFLISGNHTIKLVAHAAPAMMSSSNEFRQFEMFVDGLNFFHMPRIFELGNTSHRSPPKKYDNSNKNRAIGNSGNVNDQGPFGVPSDFPVLNSFVQNDKYQSPVANISFETRAPAYSEIRSDMTVQSEALSYEAASMYDQNSRNQITSDMTIRSESRSYGIVSTPDRNLRDSNQFNFQSSSFATSPTSSNPLPLVKDAPFSIPPSRSNDASLNNIMSCYNLPPSGFSGLQPESGNFPVNKPQITSVQPQYTQSLPPTHNDTATTVSASLLRDSPVSSIATPDFTEPSSANPLQRNIKDSPQSICQLGGLQQEMQKLVNFDHMCVPLEAPVKLTTIESKKMKKSADRSRGLPPLQTSWNLGAQASLADIKANAFPRETLNKDVMRASVFGTALSQDAVFNDATIYNYQAAHLQKSYNFNSHGGAR